MHRQFIFVLLILCLGCAPSAPNQTPKPASSQQAQQSQSAQRLMDLFKQAHEKHDIEAMRRLVYWEGVDATTRKSVEDSIAADFGSPIKRIFIENLAGDEKLEYSLGGVTYRPNLKPIGKMRVEFASSKVGQLTILTMSD